MAVKPRHPEHVGPALRLAPFSLRHAPLVASWVGGEQEAFWLAPRTPPPITAASVCAWQAPGRQGWVMHEDGGPRPVAYGELNVLNVPRREHWLGHLIVDPQQRGRGLGTALTRLLVQRAFQVHGAALVSLVVFPENAPAIRSYRTVGLIEDGHELHHFPARGCQALLLRMVARNLA